MSIYNIIKEEYDAEINNIIKKASNLELSKFINKFNKKMKIDGIIKMYLSDYGDDINKINSAVASRFLNDLSFGIGNEYNEVEFKNQSKNPENHFQMVLYGLVAVYTSPFIYVNEKHEVVSENTKIELLDLRDGDNYFETLLELK
jgi:hypothetical protein